MNIRKKMNQKGIGAGLILLIIAVVIAVAGVGFYVYQRSRDNAPSANVDEIVLEDGSVLEVASVEGEPFVVTFTSNVDGEVYTLTAMYDGEGNSESTIMADGREVRTITTPDAVYTCTEGQCYKMSINSQDIIGEEFGIDVSDVEYNNETFDAYRETASYIGRQPCPAGTCDVWEFVYDQLGEQTTLYIDVATRRISEIRTADTSIVYEYKPVTINIPTDYIEQNL